MFNEKLVEGLGKSSMIRAMFEEGARLKKIYGDDKVYDFSLGNPELEPPVKVIETLRNMLTAESRGFINT